MKRLLDIFRKPAPVVIKPAKKVDYLETYMKTQPIIRTTLLPIHSAVGTGIHSRDMTPEEIAEYFHVIQSMTGSFKVVAVKTPEEELAERVLSKRNSHL